MKVLVGGSVRVIAVAVAATFSVVTLLATSRAIRPSDVITDRLEFRQSFAMQEDPTTHVHAAVVHGVACFWEVNGSSWSDHAFAFEEPGDRLTVRVEDADGVEPGRSIHYALFHKDAAGQPLQGFAFFTEAPASATAPVHSFSFEISAGQTDPQLAVRPGEPISGTYELFKPTRNIAVTLEFALAKTMTVRLCEGRR